MKTMKMLAVKVVFLMGLAVLSLGAAHSARAQEVPTIMVAGEDGDPDTIERDNQDFNLLLDGLMAEFHAKGFRVYDERALCLRAGCAQDRTRRTDAEILDVARGMNSPSIDMVLLFQAFPEVTRFPYRTDVKLRIRARLLKIPEGRPAVEPFLDEKYFTASVDCNSACILRETGKHGRELARDVGDWMSTSLHNQVYTSQPAQAVAPSPTVPAQPSSPDKSASASPPSCPMQTKDFVLTFDGFTSADMIEVEKKLVIFSGYCSHSPVPNATGSKVTRLNFEAGISEARLQRNLEKILREVLGAQGTVQARSTSLGREYIVRKMNNPAPRAVQDTDF